MKTPFPYRAYKRPPFRSSSPGSWEERTASYFSSQDEAKYRPLSCTHPAKSPDVILLGKFKSGWSGTGNVTGALSTVTRSRPRVRGYGPILAARTPGAAVDWA